MARNWVGPMNRHVYLLAFAGMLSGSEPAYAASALDGASMMWPWSLPFVGMLLSIASGPLLFPKVWHAHYGKVAFGWAALTLTCLAIFNGRQAALAAFVQSVFREYLSFILLLFALYIVAGGILVTGRIQASPWTNTGMLALGTSIASVIGTTGAAMILIRPMIRANESRSHKTHVIIFFIILVANVGGALTPLGDPPLFIGFLHGVDFFWTTRNLWLQTVIVAVLVLAIFLAIDTWHFRNQSVTRNASVRPGIRGQLNFVLIAIIIAAMLASAAWKLGIAFDLYGSSFELQNLLRDGVFIAVALASLWLTPEEHRAANGFSWEPIREVAILFAGLFVTIIPVEAMLRAGSNGAFAFLLQAVTAPGGGPNEAAYFWLTGALSAFLDNAPTYLVFFQLAGGDPKELMGPLAGTLASISMGAVYMGALTYVGNAPNFMVYAIAQENGIRMPSFFGYMFWAGVVLIPLFALLTLLPIAPLLVM
jgi:Na+/H+ antiporter NhaD/arsenite permease-like protein